MIIDVKSFLSNKNETLGVLSIDGTPMCWTLEDEHRDTKVMSETRIPAGEYKIGLRKEGGHHVKYGAKFPTIHEGMLELQDVPNFKYILIHIGNTDEDTAGCLLVGNSAQIGSILTVGESTVAYKRIYTIIANTIKNGKDVKIIIKDHDR